MSDKEEIEELKKELAELKSEMSQTRKGLEEIIVIKNTATKKELEELKNEFKDFKNKPRRMSSDIFISIVGYIRENNLVSKEELINNFSVLSNSSSFSQFKRALDSEEIAYVWVKRKNVGVRFVYLKNNKHPIYMFSKRAIEAYDNTKRFKEILFEYRTVKEYTGINEAILMIFEDAVRKRVDKKNPFPLKKL